jgi:hypothetical protein
LQLPVLELKLDGRRLDRWRIAGGRVREWLIQLRRLHDGVSGGMFIRMYRAVQVHEPDDKLYHPVSNELLCELHPAGEPLVQHQLPIEHVQELHGDWIHPRHDLY